MAEKSYLPFGESVVSWRETTYVKTGNLGSGGSSNTFLTLATSGPYRGLEFAVKIFDHARRRTETQARSPFTRVDHC